MGRDAHLNEQPCIRLFFWGPITQKPLVYVSQGHHNETHFQQALAGYEKDLGSDHAVTLNSVANLAFITRQEVPGTARRSRGTPCYWQRSDTVSTTL